MTCLVDNTAKLSSRCWAEHGCSFLVETPGANVLFDTGQSGTVLAHNQAVLEVSLKEVSTVVLSHGHYDHTGGLEHALSLVGDVEIVAHPDLFCERFASREGDEIKSVGVPFTRQELGDRCRLRLTSEPTEAAPGVATTGQVTRGFAPEPRDSRLVVRREGELVPDPLLDDQSLVLETGEGLVVILGCCHAGLVNTLEHVRRRFSGRIQAVLGGTHLASADDEYLSRTVSAVHSEYGVERLYLGHCTGARGLIAFAHAMGKAVEPCPAGLVVQF